MQDNEKSIFRVTLSNGQSKDYTEQEYRDKGVANWLKEYHAGNFNVYRLDASPIDSIADNQQYLVSIKDANGNNISKLYSGSDFMKKDVGGWLNTYHKDNYSIQRVRGYNDADLAVDEDRYAQQAREQRAAIEKHDADNKKFYSDHEYNTLLYNQGEGIQIDEQAYQQEEQRYRELKEERRKLQEAYSNNPLVKMSYKAEASYADQMATEYREKAEQSKQRSGFIDPEMVSLNYGRTRESANYDMARQLERSTAKLYSADAIGSEDNAFLGYIKQMGKGAANTFSEKAFWTRGMSNIPGFVEIRTALKRIEAKGLNLMTMTEKEFDENFRDDEKALISAYIRNVQAQADRAADLAEGYTAGQTAAESVGYMAEFLLTAGIGKAVGGAMEAGGAGFRSWITRELRKGSSDAIESYAKRRLIGQLDGKLMNAGARAAARDVVAAGTREGAGEAARVAAEQATKQLTKDLATRRGVAAAAKASAYPYTAVVRPIEKGIFHTALHPTTYSSIAESLATIDDNGELIEAGDAIWGTVLDQVIENWSESIGDAYEGVLDLPFTFAAMREAKGKALGKVTLGTWGKWLRDSQATRLVHQAGFHGLIGEMGEEWIGNAARVGLGIMDKDEFKEFASLHQQLEMAASFAPMTLFGLGTSTYATTKQAKDFRAAADAMRGVLNRQGMSEEEIQDVMDAKHSQKEIADALSPVLQSIVKSAYDGKTKYDDYVTTLKFAQVSAMNEVLASAQTLQREADRKEMRNEIGMELGAVDEQDKKGTFTMQVETGAVDKDGNPLTMEYVTTVGDADGNAWFLVGREGSQVALKGRGELAGELTFMDEAEYAAKIESGELKEETKLADKYLDEQVEAKRNAMLAKQRSTEFNDKFKELSAKLPIGSTINLGTEEAPTIGVVSGVTRDGVLVEFPKPVNLNGVLKPIHLISLEQAGNAVGVDAAVRDQEQMEADAVDLENISRARVRTYNNTFAGKTFTIDGKAYTYERMFEAPSLDETGTEMAKVAARDEDGNVVEIAVPLKDMQEQMLNAAEAQQAEASLEEAEAAAAQADDGILRDFRGNPIPMRRNEETNTDEVDKREFKRRDPEAYYRWNDSRRGGVTTDSQQALKADIAAESAVRDGYAKQLETETDPDTRDELETKRVESENKINLYAGILHKYQAAENYKELEAEIGKKLYDVKKRMLAAKTQEQYDALEAQQVQLVSEYLTQTRDSARNVAYRTMAAEYQRELNAIADLPVVVTTARDIQQTLIDDGASQNTIDSVMRKVAEIERENILNGTNLVMDGLHNNGKVYIFVEGNPSVETAKVTYFHERQHDVNKHNPGVVDAVYDLHGGNREELMKTLGAIIGNTGAYTNSSERTLADEIVAFTMERAHTDSNYVETLKAMGLADELINIISNEYGRQTGTPANSALRSEDRDVRDGERDTANYRINERSGEAVSGEEQLGSVRHGVDAAEVSESVLSPETEKELEDKGLVMDGGVVMAPEYSQLKQTLGYLTPNERETDIDLLRYSIRTLDWWKETYSKYPDHEERVIRILEGLADRMAANDLVYNAVSHGEYKRNRPKDKGQGRWQNNMTAQEYIPEISKYFGDVKRRGQLIEARNPIPTDEQSIWSFDGSYDGNNEVSFRATINKRKETNNQIDRAVAMVTGDNIRDVVEKRRARERRFKEETTELYSRVLDNQFDDVTLQLIDDYISKVTPDNPYGRPLSKRLPPRVGQTMRRVERNNAVDALFTRIAESSIRETGSGLERARAKREIEKKKQELLKGWAIATGNWHTSVSDFTDNAEPIGRGKDSIVYESNDGNSVIKVSFGKNKEKKFSPDIDAVNLFNSIFRNTRYEILGYGEIDGRFVKFLRQPAIRFAEVPDISVDERTEYMQKIGFSPINKDKSAFSNGELVAADIQKGNIVRDVNGEIRVIDADVKLHTKDFGGEYTYPPASDDVIDNATPNFRVVNNNQQVFISNSLASLDKIPMKSGNAQAWINKIQQAGGLKKEEDKWMGLTDWLKEQKGNISKEDVAEFIREHQIQIEEVKYGIFTIENYRSAIAEKMGIEFRDKFLEAFDVWPDDDNYKGFYTTVNFDNDAAELYNEYHEDKVNGDDLENEELNKIIEWSDEIVWSSISDGYELINPIRLDYTTDGLLYKREIALTVPTIDPYNEKDDIHFGDAGEGRAVAWSRFGEAVDENGNRVLVIDEIQSKRHQEGKEKGYKGDKEYQDAKDRYDRAVADVNAYWKELMHKYGIDVNTNMTPDEKSLLDNKTRVGREAFLDLEDKIQKQKQSVPDAPFRDSWDALAMKRMLRLAAEEGYDKIAWTSGQMQSDRYDLTKVLGDFYYKPNEDGTYKVSAALNQKRPGYTDYSDLNYDSLTVERIGEIFGKEIAAKVSEGKGRKGYSHNDERDWVTFSGRELKMANEGMRYFYDQKLVNWMNKYGKRWGVQVADLTLPDLENTDGWHSVDVTPEMKGSVMEGQPMFRATEVAGNPSLIAVHNLTENDLLNAFDLGGFPMPSIAITKADIGHTDFGDISLVFDKETINPKNRKNKVYSGDAWTPTFPTINYKLNEDKASDIATRARKVGDLPLFNPSHFNSVNYEGRIEDSDARSLIEEFKNDYNAKQFYLAEQGNPVREFEMHEVEKYTEENVRRIKELLDKIGLENLKSVDRNLSPEILQVVKGFLNAVGDLDDSRIKRIARNYVLNAIDYATKGNRTTEIDYGATHRKIDERIDQSAFEKWLEDLFSGIVEKRGIRNEVDMFTPIGNRRAWEKLYDEVTLDNVVKAMSKKPARGGSGFFGGNIFGASFKTYNSIADIREDAARRMAVVDSEELQKQKDDILNRLSNVKVTEKELGVGEMFDLTTNIKDAVAESHTAEGIHRYLKDYYPDITMEAAQEIADIVKDIQSISTKYFEAKPYRAVGFDEVKLAVVPEGTSQAIVDGLQERGVPVRTYEKDNQQERMDIISNATEEMGLRFRTVELTPETRGEMEKIKALARLNGTYLKAPNGADTKLTPEQWAMVRTKAFKDWFGNWEGDPANASKVVDENGEPMVVYHGSDRAAFAAFNTKKSEAEAIFMSSSPNTAGTYTPQNKPSLRKVYDNSQFSDFESEVEEASREAARIVKEEYGFDVPDDFFVESFRNGVGKAGKEIEEAGYEAIYEVNQKTKPIEPEKPDLDTSDARKMLQQLSDYKKARDKYEAERELWLADVYSKSKKLQEIFWNLYQKYNGGVYGLFANLRNPLVIDANHHSFKEVKYGDKMTSAANVARSARDEGYDGVIIKDVYDEGIWGSTRSFANDYIAFDPNQVKSATDNNGSFDPTDPDIRYRVTPAQDAEYQKSYEDGDEAKAIEMLDAAAIAAGYDTKAFHGTEKGFNVFQADYRTGGNFFTPQEDAAKAYANAQSFGKGGVVMPVYLNLGKTFEIDAKGSQWDEVPIEWEVDSQKDDYDEFFDSYSDAEKEALKHPDAVISSSGISDTNDVAKRAKNDGYDSVVIRNVYDPADNSYTSMQDDIVIFTPSRIKSAEPFTFDDNGNLIPLSQRFNPDNNDIRFRVGENLSEAEEDSSEDAYEQEIAKDIENVINGNPLVAPETEGVKTETNVDNEVLYRFIGIKGATRLDKELGENRIARLAETLKYYSPDSAENIKRVYGWELSRDDKGNMYWKYEEDDFGIDDIKVTDGAKLSDVVNDDNLFIAYPELKDYTLKLMNMNLREYGSINHNDKVIKINNYQGKKEKRRTLIHEIQHFIQDMEGWVNGTEMESEEIINAVDAIMPEFRQDLKDLVNTFAGMFIGRTSRRQFKEERKDFGNKWGVKPLTFLVSTKQEDLMSYAGYMRKAGEVEARNAERRAGMTTEERRKSLAKKTQDVVTRFQWSTTPFLKRDKREKATAEKAMAGLHQFDKGVVSDMLMKTYGDMPLETRKNVTDLAFRNGLKFGKAVVDYFSTLANRTDELNEYELESVYKMRDNLTKALGIESMSIYDALWAMVNTSLEGKDDLLSVAKRAASGHKLGRSVPMQAVRDKADEAIRFSIRDNMQSNSAADMYNKATGYWLNRLKEGYVDMNESVNDLVAAIEKATGMNADSYEDVRLSMNQQSSKGLAAMKKYNSEYLEPMWDAIKEVMKVDKVSYDEVVRYVMLKHALERNEVFAKRDARAFYKSEYDKVVNPLKDERKKQERRRKNALANGDLNTAYDAESKINDIDTQVNAEEARLNRHYTMVDNGTAAKYKELREKDYGGLTSMYSDYPGLMPRRYYKTEEEYNQAAMRVRQPKYQTVAEMEDAARDEIKEQERYNDFVYDKLWDAINKATKQTLQMQYQSGILSKQQYEYVRDMFKYYVPMRGFKDTTAEDLWTYYNTQSSGSFAPTLVTASGRKTEAENPFNWIGTMASSAIAQGMKNETKLALYYFIANRPNQDLAKIGETWYEFDAQATAEYQANHPGSKKRIFSAAVPPYLPSANVRTVTDAYETWEQDMVNKAKQGLAYRGKNSLDLSDDVAFIDSKQSPQHIIRLKLRGEPKTIIVNGNPRAAQAINGLLNVETSEIYDKFGSLLRWMSAVNTSYNPEFWISNMQRDLLFATMSMDIKGDGKRNFYRNLVGPWKIMKMMKDYENGSLGNSKTENYYREFAEEGAITGFTVVVGNEEWEKRIDQYINPSLWNKMENSGFMQFWQNLGEAVEQMTRFSAYVTARESGKGVTEAVNAAKEISVNFNRKGSGLMINWDDLDKLTTKDGKKLGKLGKTAVYLMGMFPPYARSCIMFFNAAVQGLNAMYKLVKKNKAKAAAWMGGYIVLGALQAVMHSLVDDDDDYLDMPDYTRHNNLLLGYGGVYFKWALPQEARAFYALGDMAVNHIMGRQPNKSFTSEALDALMEMLPVNPAAGVSGALPSIVQPLVEIVRNKDYRGARVYNDLKFLSESEKANTPRYTAALPKTSVVYINMAKLLNDISGGNEYDAGAVNLAPEWIQQVVEGVGGGLLTTFGKVQDVAVGAFNAASGLGDSGESLSVRRTPFLGRLLEINDERTRNAHVNELYYFYSDEAAHTKIKMSKMKKDQDIEALNDLLDSKEYSIYQVFKKYEPQIKMYNDQLKIETDMREKRLLMQEQDEVKKQMIREISEIR